MPIKSELTQRREGMDIIERYTNPSKHVQAPYSGIVKNGENYFIQVSKIEETPKWVSLGKLLSFCYQDQFTNDNFIKDVLSIYENKIAQPGAASFNSLDFEDSL